MTSATAEKIPAHLKRFVVEQNYARYTHEDQAVWRYILRQLRAFLSVHAHPIYLEGLRQTGIEVDRIPEIASIDAHLERFGWGAVPVSGFIPPAAFMEFQSLGVLPIASDLRSLKQLLYTPAPDIVHEAAGHAPILVDPEYSAFLRAYGDIARYALISQNDLDQYEAIRRLSDVKGDPRSTWSEIKGAEERLQAVTAGIRELSEAAKLSRLNWWTAEYGLIGSTNKPKLYGAGLLSSIGESRACLSPEVAKIPLSVDCVGVGYDITEMQPQLFVARNFAHLAEVLEQFAATLACRRGGRHGVEAARAAGTVNTVVCDEGLQIAGRLTEIIYDDYDQPAYLIFSGPTQIAHHGRELDGQGTSRHQPGFSLPLGQIPRPNLDPGTEVNLRYASGILITGRTKAVLATPSDEVVGVTLLDADVRLGDRVLFQPEWGEYDLFFAERIVSVRGGPADRAAFGASDEFIYPKMTPRRFSGPEQTRLNFFLSLRHLRQRLSQGAHTPAVLAEFKQLVATFLQTAADEWLPGLELVEISFALNLTEAERAPLLKRLEIENYPDPMVQGAISEGLRLATTA